MGKDARGVMAETAWRPVASDPLLSRPPSSGSAGNVPPGDDLRLDIGWDRFEQLLVALAHGVVGLNGIRFRRYGVSGQAQHGIDLAGRGPAGAYTVVQCKEYESFTPADLRAAVEKFTNGKKPFGAKHLIVAVSTVARTTQIEEELANLQDEHEDVDIELWGAEQINDELRTRADIVSRFWTRETAETFCTGAPLPGVAAPAPDWVRVADQILLSPLGVDGLDERLIAADSQRVSDPEAAADQYREIADTLVKGGFTGHAYVIRRKQLDALTEANELDAVAALTAHLAALALHEGDMDQARSLERHLDALVRDDARGTGVKTPAMIRHAELISAAVYAAEHPLADSSALASALRNPPPDLHIPGYQPLLVILLAELTAADMIAAPADYGIAADSSHDDSVLGSPDMVRLAELDDLISSALAQLTSKPAAGPDQDIVMRLRMVRACFDDDERTNLLVLARQLRLPRRHAALVLAAQARRDALDGSSEEALEHWRQAVGHAIHDGRTDAAKGWLYAIRAVNTRYGPWTDRMDEEHLLAQALPKVGNVSRIHRVRDPETDARRAALADRPNDAIHAARRWLADSVVIGDWMDEHAAVELLGDLYASNAEPERAAACYQWAGKTKKLTKLAAGLGDRLLPPAPIKSGPWWRQATSLAGVAEQHDLLDDDTAGKLLTTLLDVVARGRAGELVDGPTHGLTLQATKTACVLAGRGTTTDAQALLDLFADDVARGENQYHHHDKQHVEACRNVAVHHKDLVWPALVRIFDLADAGTHDALKALSDDVILDLLREPSSQANDALAAGSDRTPQTPLTAEQRQLLGYRLNAMAADGRYDAGVAVSALGGSDKAVTERALQARDRLLNRPEPDGHSFSFGTRMVPDSYLVSFLGVSDQKACLDKVMTIAADRREAAQNRQDALTAASNLVLGQSDDVKAAVHAFSRGFVDGHQDGSALDSQTNTHPLSTMKVNLGSLSLRAEGLRLAQFSAVTNDDRAWLRDRAVTLLGNEDEHLVRKAAVTLSGLSTDGFGGLDAALLAGHPLPTVRQLAAVVAVAAPVRYAQSLHSLAADPDRKVRTLLAHRLRDAQTSMVSEAPDATASIKANEGTDSDAQAVVADVLQKLAQDARHTVRQAAEGFAT
jgi:hypothetical protein